MPRQSWATGHGPSCRREPAADSHGGRDRPDPENNQAQRATVVAMADLIHANLRDSRFERVDLSGTQLRAMDLSSAMFRGGSRSAPLTGAI